MTTGLLVEKSGGIATVTFNRPAVKNALSFAMCRELTEFFRSLNGDGNIKVVVIRGDGADFTSGADLNDVSSLIVPLREARSAAAAQQVRELSWPLFLALHDVKQPVIASVRGYAVGAGAQLALAADLVIASATARFVMPQVKLGHSVDHGESWYLPRKVGAGRALQLLLLGDTVGAADAERYGIVNWLVADEALDQKTAEIAERLAASASVAVTEIKKLLRESAGYTLKEQLEAEARSLGICAATDDFAEAIAAFLAKRKPVFTGR
jgi:2-(1,2-epoxy-1,2-dihydrophenyl)acetyl-CoA isomerase